MLTKANAKFIKSLQLKKYRKQEQLFVVEGAKSVLEALNSTYEVTTLVATESFIDNNQFGSLEEVIVASPKELSILGSFKTNDTALAIVRQKANESLEISQDELALVLDDISDPGNLGTIIRIADWYGISNVIASPETVELYNPKVIAASKGSFCRVNVFYDELCDFLGRTKLTKYGAFMEGDNLHKMKLAESGLIVIGNEANGISEKIATLIDHKISIPRFGGAESLNVAMATAVICDNFRRID